MAAEKQRDRRAVDNTLVGPVADATGVARVAPAEDSKGQPGANEQYTYVTPPNTPPGATNRKCPGAPKRRRRQPRRQGLKYYDDSSSESLGSGGEIGGGWETALQPRNLFE